MNSDSHSVMICFTDMLCVCVQSILIDVTSLYVTNCGKGGGAN